VTRRREFDFAVECCRCSFAGAKHSAFAPPMNLAWGEFLRLARFHRIEGLAWNALADSDLPSERRKELSEMAASIAATNLLAAEECRTLQDRFKGAGVPLLILKGLPLGALAYGNAALKSAIDIDLLIHPAELGEAARLLRENDYRLRAPRESSGDQALHQWHRGWKESVWRKEGVQIDLHTRTADNPRLIPSIDVNSPRQWVSVSTDLQLPTLADEELFAYLTVHGASSAWFRLKWISDFAGFLHGRSAEELRHLYRRSQELGAGRAPGQALLLAHELFGTLQHCAALAEELRRDPTILSLYRTALRVVAGEPVEPTARRCGTLPIHRTQFQLLPGPAYKFSELSRQVMRLLTRAD